MTVSYKTKGLIPKFRTERAGPWCRLKTVIETIVSNYRACRVIRHAQRERPSEAWGRPAEFARRALGFEPDERQEAILNSRGRRLILNCSRQWGKSTVTAVRLVFEAMTRPGSLSVIAAPTDRQSGELVKKAAGFGRRVAGRLRGDGLNDISLLFPNGSRIVGLPGKEKTIRGFSAASMVVLDEAARVPDEVYWALRPMLAVSDGDLWLLSTPFGKRGFFYETWSSGDPGWERETVPASECKRIPAEFLEEERRAMGEEWVRQEYGCEFVDVDSSLFDREVLMGAITEDAEPLAV